MTDPLCLKTGFAAAMTSMLGTDLPQKMAVAVSGGGDSMALLYLAARGAGAVVALAGWGGAC